jgi:predicted dithiol-disulfide oxidoreductase (DUF899 family)
MELPQIASEEEWRESHDALLAKEKEATHAGDALAAERRRMPMVEYSTDYEFEGPDGVVTLPDLFDGCRQLILYHFWFPPDGEPCSGCSMLTDQIPPLAHLNARDTSYTAISRASQPEIREFKQRMGWEIPWYTVVGDEFQEARGTTEYFSMDFYLRDENRVFLTYEVRGRGVETLGTIWTLLDRTALGRQEEWEDSPEDYPQTPPYQWWRLHDEYEQTPSGASR